MAVTRKTCWRDSLHLYGNHQASKGRKQWWWVECKKSRGVSRRSSGSVVARPWTLQAGSTERKEAVQPTLASKQPRLILRNKNTSRCLCFIWQVIRWDAHKPRAGIKSSTRNGVKPCLSRSIRSHIWYPSMPVAVHTYRSVTSTSPPWQFFPSTS